MIAQVQKDGEKAIGLLKYLYGPGRHHEHEDPHIVAGWGPPEAIEPRLKDNGKPDLLRLAEVLEAPLALMNPARRLDKPVWHCSIRAAPEDRRLTDEEWQCGRPRNSALAMIT